MIKNNIAELIKAHKDNIITKIEQAEVISLTPSFYGSYDLYRMWRSVYFSSL